MRRWALAVAGILLLGVAPVLSPPPIEFEHAASEWSRGSPVETRLAVGHPIHVGYDAASDTTTLVPRCAHGPCQTAAIVQGNYAGGFPVTALLRAPDRQPGTVSLASPFPVEGMGGTRNVTQAYQGTFAVQRPWADIALHLAGLGALTAALVLGARRKDKALQAGPPTLDLATPVWPAQATVAAALVGLVAGLVDSARGVAAFEVPLPGQDLGPSVTIVFLGLPIAALALLMLANRHPAARSFATALLWGLAAWLLTTSRFLAFVSPAPAF